MGENAEKRKALEVAMSQIEKQFGKGSVMKLGEYKAMEVEAIPTGALSLDIALGEEELLKYLDQNHQEKQH